MYTITRVNMKKTKKIYLLIISKLWTEYLRVCRFTKSINWFGTGETTWFPSAGLCYTDGRFSIGRVDVSGNPTRGHHKSCAFFTGSQKQLNGRNISLRAKFVRSRIRSQINDRTRVGCFWCQIKSYRQRNGMHSRGPSANRKKEWRATGE